MFQLQISNISKAFSQKQVLQDVSLSLESGASYALLGENGAGKSTLATIVEIGRASCRERVCQYV